MKKCNIWIFSTNEISLYIIIIRDIIKILKTGKLFDTCSVSVIFQKCVYHRMFAGLFDFTNYVKRNAVDPTRAYPRERNRDNSFTIVDLFAQAR